MYNSFQMCKWNKRYSRLKMPEISKPVVCSLLTHINPSYRVNSIFSSALGYTVRKLIIGARSQAYMIKKFLQQKPCFRMSYLNLDYSFVKMSHSYHSTEDIN